MEIAGVLSAVQGAFILASPVEDKPSGAGPVAAGVKITGVACGGGARGGGFSCSANRINVGRPKDVERRIRYMAQLLLNVQHEEQLSELQARAIEVFGDRDAALMWLDTNLSALDNLSPRQIVTRAGAPGLERARDVLLRIEYGVYS